MARVRVHNLRDQAHTVSVKTATGTLDTRIVPGRGFLELDFSELTQDIYDKNARGHIRLIPAVERKPPTPPAPAQPDKRADKAAPQPATAEARKSW